MTLLNRLSDRSRLSVFSYLLIAVLALSLTAACGSDDDDDADTDTDAGTTTTATTGTGGTTATQAGDAATETEDEATEETDADATTSGGGGAAEVGAIGSCLQENTTGDMVTELREGNTESAEEVYRTCLEDALPAGLVAQLDPVIDNAAECGSTAAQDLSDADVEAIEGGDEAAIQSLTQDTLTCVSEELGIPLS